MEAAGKTIHIRSINNSHVGVFHKELSKYAPKTYNHHIQALKSFFDWLINYGYEISNPFKDVQSKYIVKSPKIILEEQIEEMLQYITFENGWQEYSYKGKPMRRNLYKEWLKQAIGLFLLTGERRDGVFYLKWSDQKGNYLEVPNYKVNLIQNVSEHRDILITPDLAELLLSIPRGESDYIIAPDRANREQVKNECSKAFTHFWKLAGHLEERKLSHLRKTYITRMRALLGDLSKVLKVHSNNDTEIAFPSSFF